MVQSKKQRSEGIALGTVAGVPIVLAYSWFLIAGYIVLVFGPRVAQRFPDLGAGAYGVALSYALLLLLSVLVHELAHALLAKVFSWPTEKIVLNLWGGHTQLSGFQATPGRSVLVALAGPAANFALALVGWLLLSVVAPFSVGQLLANIFVWANLLVALFNVLPGLPLDGGRMVESAVWKATGSQDKGTVAAGWAGRIIVIALGVLMIGLPLLRGGFPDLTVLIITVLVGTFLWMGASGAINGARIRLRVPSVSARGLMQPAVGLPTDSSAAEAAAALAALPTGAVVLLKPDGTPGSVIDSDALRSVPEALRASTPAKAVARPLSDAAFVLDSAEGQALVQAMAKLELHEYAVLDRYGRITGLLRQSTVVSAVTGRSHTAP